LKKLEEEGLIQFNESFYSPSQIFITVDKARLYEFQVANARFDPLIKMLLRLYGGQLATDFTTIAESYIANALNISTAEVVNQLNHLHALNIIIYNPVRDKPMITFVLPRQDADKLPIDRNRLNERKALAEGKMNAMIEFVSSTHRCRMELIQDYFGEEVFQPCGKCDVCVAARKKDNSFEVSELRNEILHVIKENAITVEQLEEIIEPRDSELFIEVVREMVDEGLMEYDAIWRLRITNLENGKGNL
jgi:ATP-dependent DNA helicase RecQ